jgi:hypothetical protein
MSSATAWYSLTSATFWADLIAVAGVVATVIVGNKALPKRRLRCTVVSRTRLMNAPQSVRDSLKISYKRRSLGDPYVVVLEIASTGRLAIPSTSFDNGRSLRLSFNADIETILSTEYQPSSATKPVVEAQGNAVEFKPELIARRETVRVSLLTDGNPGSVSVSLNPFTDVGVETADQEAALARRAKWRVISTSVLVVLTVCAIGAAIFYTLRSVRQSRALSMGTICVTITKFDQTAELGMRLVRRDIVIDETPAGSIRSIKFSRSYDADVQELEDPGRYLIVEYGLVGNQDASRTAAGLTQVLNMLPKLPHEGTGSAANRDIAEFNEVINQISNPPNPQALGCST